MLLSRCRGEESWEQNRALDSPAWEMISCYMLLFYLQESDPDGRRFLCRQRVKQMQPFSLNFPQYAMNPQPSKEKPSQPTGTLWILSNTLWTAKAKSEFDAFITVAAGGEIHATAFCACPWLTVLSCAYWVGIACTESPPATRWGFSEKKPNPKELCTEWVIREILERHKICHILNPKGLPFSVLLADHLSIPDYSCSLPAFQTTSSYLHASSCTETLSNCLYTAPAACSFYKASKTIALPCTRNQLLINSQKAKLLHVYICIRICIKYIYT